MKSKQFFTATAIYFVASFAIGYLWHITLWKQTYDNFRIFGDDILNPNMPVLVIGTLIEALAFSFLYVRLNIAGNSLLSGIVLGICMYLFASSYGIFAIASAAHLRGYGTSGFIAIEMAYFLIAGTICGGVVGAFVKK